MKEEIAKVLEKRFGFGWAEEPDANTITFPNASAMQHFANAAALGYLVMDMPKLLEKSERIDDMPKEVTLTLFSDVDWAVQIDKRDCAGLCGPSTTPAEAILNAFGRAGIEL